MILAKPIFPTFRFRVLNLLFLGPRALGLTLAALRRVWIMVVSLSFLKRHCAVRPRESLAVVHSVWRVMSSSSRFQEFLGQILPGFFVHQEYLLAQTASACLPYSEASCTAYMILLYFSEKGTIDLSMLCILYHILAAVR